MKGIRKTARDRRRYKRYPLSAAVSFRILRLPAPIRMINMLDSLRRGRTHDISAGGVCFHSTHLLLPGTIIRLMLPRSRAGKSSSRRARVVWMREVRSGDFRVGVKFI